MHSCRVSQERCRQTHRCRHTRLAGRSTASKPAARCRWYRRGQEQQPQAALAARVPAADVAAANLQASNAKSDPQKAALLTAPRASKNAKKSAPSRSTKNSRLPRRRHYSIGGLLSLGKRSLWRHSRNKRTKKRKRQGNQAENGVPLLGRSRCREKKFYSAPSLFRGNKNPRVVLHGIKIACGETPLQQRNFDV